jgi:hypothetical protein
MYQVGWKSLYGCYYEETVFAKDVEKALSYINDKYDYLICVRDIQKIEEDI